MNIISNIRVLINLMKSFFTRQKTKSSILLHTLVLIFSSCASPLYISDEEWTELHTIIIKTNQNNFYIQNRKGEYLSQTRKGNNVSVYIPKLRSKYLKLTLSHNDREKVNIKINRSIRRGALICDLTFGSLLCWIPVLVDFGNTNIYQIKKSSRFFDVFMPYNDIFYQQRYSEAVKQGDVSAFENFYKKYPESTLADEAMKKCYELAWNETTFINKINTYENYIAKYPKAPYVGDAWENIYKLGLEEAITQNTPEAFDNYINKYPNSSKIDEAKNLRKTVKEIDDAFAQAKSANTYQAYSDFNARYPDCKYIKESSFNFLSRYYIENKEAFNNLSGCNEYLAWVKAYEKKFMQSYDYRIVNEIETFRDQHIVNNLKTISSREAYLNFLKDQYKTENGKDPVENEVFSIKERVLGNIKVLINGAFIFWDYLGQKELVNYENNNFNGSYTKYATDSKTILEKGEYKSGIKNGKFSFNYPDGKKYMEQVFTEGNKLYEISFDENGQLKHEEGYFEANFNKANFNEFEGWEICFSQIKKGFAPADKVLCFYEGYEELEKATLTKLIWHSDSVLKNLNTLKKFIFRIHWATDVDDGVGTYHYEKGFKHHLITKVDLSDELTVQITNEIEKQRKEAIKPRLGVNYWVSTDSHECDCCYNFYKRTTYKYTSYQVALEHDPWGALDWYSKTLKMDGLSALMNLTSAAKKGNYFYIYKPDKESCGRKGCRKKCGD